MRETILDGYRLLAIVDKSPGSVFALAETAGGGVKTRDLVRFDKSSRCWTVTEKGREKVAPADDEEPKR